MNNDYANNTTFMKVTWSLPQNRKRAKKTKSFSKEQLENAEQCKLAFNKIMTTHKKCVK